MLCFIATETEGVGLHGDGYSSEENDESIYHDYEGAYEVEGKQHYDCSSEESDTESESNVNFDIMSKESDTTNDISMIVVIGIFHFLREYIVAEKKEKINPFKQNRRNLNNNNIGGI
ncbi:hypothetical protein YC2023_040291 [Brassica napus]